MKTTVKRIEDFLEYLLCLVVILECSSMYVVSVRTAGDANVLRLFYLLAPGIVLALLALNVVSGRGQFGFRARDIVVPVALLGYGGVFYLLNVRRSLLWAQKEFILVFLIFLPLATVLFKIRRREGRPFELLYKHSDIVCVLAALGLLVWLASVARPNDLGSDVIYTRWNGRGRIVGHVSLLDVCQFVAGSNWKLFGISLLRNKGLFAEPLLFALPLLIALFTELFLREKSAPWRIYRCLLLTAALVMVNATIGLMLMAVAWGVKGVVASVEKKRRLLVIPILLAAICACFVLYMEKDRISYDDTEVSGSSLGLHIDDYRLSARAFANSPLVGNGYQNEESLRGYMSDWRLKKNFGLSNTTGVIFSEGGLMLGLLCLLPFVICLLYLSGGRNRRVACWAVGPLMAMLGIIFKYRLFLVFLMAFGYSLADADRAPGGFPLRLSLAKLEAEDGRCPAEVRGRTARRAALALVLSALLIGFGGPLWRGARVFLRSHQFSLGQSPLRAFCFAVAVLLHGVFLKHVCRREQSWNRLTALLVWDALFLAAYPLLCSGSNTLLTLRGLWSEGLECGLLLAVYLAAVPAIAWAKPANWLNRRGALATGALAVVLCAAFLIGRGTLDGASAQADALVPALEDLVEQASGEVYVDELPLLYRHQVRGVRLASTHGTGYDVCRNASVVFPAGVECGELLDAGFELAALTEDYLVYTNDSAVVTALSARGVTFYRYYPFEKWMDLGALAEQKGLERTESGVILAEGTRTTLSIGRDEVLDKGKYSVSLELWVDPAKLEKLHGNDVVCRLTVSCNGSKEKLVRKRIKKNRFDEDGSVTVKASFRLDKLSDSLKYRLKTGPDCQAEIRGISLRQIPKYVKSITYNCYRNPVREAYYNPDGTPCLMAKGYAALEREYDRASRVKAVRYYGADGQPVLMNGDYFEIRYGYNSRGSRNREAYFDIDGRPVELSGGYAAKEKEYDAYGNVRIERYLDGEGNPALNSEGYAEVRRDYNERRQVIREAYFDADGAPASIQEGYAAVEMEYDASDNVAAIRYFDISGDLIGEQISNQGDASVNES